MTEQRTFNREVARRWRRAHERRETGRLRTLVGDTEREFSFRNGQLVGARTSTEDERIGRLLVRFGLITEQHLEDAYVFVRHGRRLGETLAELGILDPARIAPMIRQQVVEVGCSVLNASEVSMSFQETSDLCVTLAKPMFVADVIMEAARRVEAVEPLVSAMLADARRFQPETESTARQLKELTPEDVYLMSRFQGGAMLQQVFCASRTERMKAARSLLGLVESGLIRADEREPAKAPTVNIDHDPLMGEVDRMYRRLERQDPWTALGLSRDVGIETAREAFRDALRRYHPDRFQRVKDAQFQRKITTLYSKFTDAYTCLTTAVRMRAERPEESVIPLDSTWSSSSSSESRTAAADTGTASKPAPTSSTSTSSTAPNGPPEHRLDGPATRATTHTTEPHVEPPPIDAETFLREGKRALSQGDYWRAIQLLQRSADMNSEHAETHYLLGIAMSKNSRWRHDAAKSFQRAIEIEPWQMSYYEAMAELYRSAGMNHRAERLLHEAKAVGAAVGAESHAHPSMALIVA